MLETMKHSWVARETLLCFKYTAGRCTLSYYLIQRTILPSLLIFNTIYSELPTNNLPSKIQTPSPPHQPTPHTPCEVMHLRALPLLLCLFLLTISISAGPLPTIPNPTSSLSMKEIPTSLPAPNTASLAKRVNWHHLWDKIKADFMNIINNG